MEIRCEFRRGGRTESVHRVTAAVVEGNRVTWRRGGAEDPVWMRSCAKPFQALAVLEAGVPDPGSAELAVMAGSHAGDREAVLAVRSILRKAGVPESALRCGIHEPVSTGARRALARAGRRPSALHNNCSGKHAGMLAAAARLGAPRSTYLRPDHPVQRRVRAVLARFTAVRRFPRGIDGCSAPTFRLPLSSMARAMGRFTETPGPVREAMLRHPSFVGRPCAWIMPAGGGRLVTKVGAEGVYVAGLAGKGIGIATKVVDGSHRATPHVLQAVLHRLRLLPGVRFADPVLRNHAGRIVGRVIVTL